MTKTRKELETEIKKLEAKVRRLQRRIRVLQLLDDAKYGPDGRQRPHSDAEFIGGL